MKHALIWGGLLGIMVISGFSDNGLPDGCIEADENTLRVLECVHTGIVLIDRRFRILKVNEAAKGLLGTLVTEAPEGVTCHFLLQQLASPCSECPIATRRHLVSAHRSLSLKRGGGSDRFFKEHFFAWGDHYLITLNDVTREILTLRKTDLDRKELQAKNIIVERHRREASEEKKRLNLLLDLLPEALVLVNDTYRIDRKNRAAGQIVPYPDTSTCFGLFGKDEPCEGCPARDGFQNASGKKTNHFVGGEYFTEEVIKSPDDDGGLLLFRNTTRQIQLIEKIREQQDTITRKNEILSSLVRFQEMTQTESESKNVIEFFLDVFIPVSKAIAISVIINDIRPGSLWFTAQRGFSDSRMAMLTRASLSGRDGDSITDTLPINDRLTEDLRQIDIRGGDGRRVGLAFIVNIANKEDEGLIQLFFKPLGAYIHNRLLMRQLEERANTDPLTGLYNRGYFDIVLSEEKKKYAEYNIPFAVVAADVNRLKQANDEYGHEAGDQLILIVARKLKTSIREMDCVARTGGDEFMLLLSNTTHDAAQSAVRRFAGTLFKDVFIVVGDGKQFPVTVSFGASGVDAVASEELLNDADRRMYEAKELYYESHKRYR
ncbi:MAG: GGDEF domain-containing protein [Pseudomonadota bacterium]